MLEREGSNSNTIWGVINGNTGEEKGEGPEWFVPSIEEFAAFGVAFSINSGNYSSTYGLSYGYWSSSHYTTDTAYIVYFDTVDIDYGIVNGYSCVRLATTF